MGLLAGIGMEKGKPFEPDEQMTRALLGLDHRSGHLGFRVFLAL